MDNENSVQNSGGGMMDRTVRVNGDMLKQKESLLSTTLDEVKALTTYMTERAGMMSGRVWTGAAQSAYMSKFTSLQADIDKYHAILQKHAVNLGVIAEQYNRTEANNVEQASDGLLTSIF